MVRKGRGEKVKEITVNAEIKSFLEGSMDPQS
jgi:hypothetical protein